MEQDNDFGSGERTFPNAEEIIQALGGIRPAAAKLGVPFTTVQGWKTRGRIPENRHVEIERRLRELGVSVTGEALVVGKDEGSESLEMPDRVDSTEAREEDNGSSVNPITEVDVSDRKLNIVAGPRSSGGTFAGIAMVLSSLALLVVGVSVFRPGIFPAPRPVNLEHVYGRLDEFEEKAFQQLDANSRALAENVANRETLEQRIEDINLRIEAVAGNLSTVGKSYKVAEIAQLRESITEIETEVLAAKSQFSEVFSKKASKIATTVADLKSQFENVDTRIAALQLAQKKADEKISRAISRRRGTASADVALLVAVGQLEATVKSGLNIENALERLRRVASQDLEVTTVLNDLEVVVTQELATSAELNKEFRQIRSVLAAGRPPAEGWGLLDGAWAQLKAAVGLRRIGDGSSSPITLAERALAKGDLSTAIEVTKGYGSEVDSWREKLGVRLHLEKNLMRLHEIVVGLSDSAIENSTAAPKKRVMQ